MKKLFFITSIFCGFTIMTAFTSQKNTNSTSIEVLKASDYCDGWEDGYCEGWKDEKGSMSLCPLTPLCPLPELGKNKYKDGYNRGFKAGIRAAQK